MLPPVNSPQLKTRADSIRRGTEKTPGAPGRVERRGCFQIACAAELEKDFVLAATDSVGNDGSDLRRPLGLRLLGVLHPDLLRAAEIEGLIVWKTQETHSA
jgi:hypothetical protein